MAESRQLTIRIPDPINERLVASVAKAGCTTTDWVLEAIRWALEQEERPHVPAAVKAAMPRRVGALMSMPDNIVYRNL
jgi:predicted DNA-binding protein